MESVKKIAILLFFLFLLANVAFGEVRIENPTKWNTFSDLINALINFIMTFALAVAPLTIVFAGYLLMTSGGNPEKINQARQIIFFTIVGLCIIFASKGLILLVQKALNKPK